MKLTDTEMAAAVRVIRARENVEKRRNEGRPFQYTSEMGNVGRAPTAERVELAHRIMDRLRAAKSTKDRDRWRVYFLRLSPWTVYCDLYDEKLLGPRLTAAEKRRGWGNWPGLARSAVAALDGK